MYAKEIRPLAEKLHSSGMSYRDISKRTGISKSTLQRWVKHVPSTDFKEAQQEREKKILATVGDFTIHSIRSIASKCKISATTVFRVLKRHLKYSIKKTHQCGNPKRIHMLSEERTQFSQSSKDLDFHNIIAIDETAVYDRMNPTRAWSPRNKRIYFPMQKLQSKKYTLITAMCDQKVVQQMVVKGSANSKIFKDFICSINSPKTHLLMDNVAFHKTKMVRKAMEEKGFTPVYTSPYSPEWNPTEMFFSYLKRKLRSVYHERTINIEAKVWEIVDGMDKTLYKHWFDHVPKDITSNFHR